MPWVDCAHRFAQLKTSRKSKLNFTKTVVLEALDMLTVQVGFADCMSPKKG